MLPLKSKFMKALSTFYTPFSPEKIYGWIIGGLPTTDHKSTSRFYLCSAHMACISVIPIRLEKENRLRRLCRILALVYHQLLWSRGNEKCDNWEVTFLRSLHSRVTFFNIFLFFVFCFTDWIYFSFSLLRPVLVSGIHVWFVFDYRACMRYKIVKYTTTRTSCVVLQLLWADYGRGIRVLPSLLLP